MLPKMTQLAEFNRWQARLPLLDLTERERQIIGPMVGSLDNFGFEEGQIRPAELGQWDVYFTLWQDWGLPKERCAMMAGLDIAEIRREENREIMKDCGFDPDSREDEAEYHRLKNMTKAGLDSEIKTLEEILKGD